MGVGGEAQAGRHSYLAAPLFRQNQRDVGLDKETGPQTSGWEAVEALEIDKEVDQSPQWNPCYEQE